MLPCNYSDFHTVRIWGSKNRKKNSQKRFIKKTFIKSITISLGYRGRKYDIPVNTLNF